MMSRMLSPTTKQCPIMSDTGSIVRRSHSWQEKNFQLSRGGTTVARFLFDRRNRSNHQIESHCSRATSEKNPGAGLVRAPRPKPRSRRFAEYPLD